MSIPLLEFSPSSQNTRVPGFEVPGDEQPRLYSSDYFTSTDEMDLLIQAAYRQVFHQQQMLAAHRLPLLESQLRNRQITVRTFIRGLATSDAFRRLNYEVNNNYRFVELCLQRLLGRSAYNQRETLAFSILLATHGLDHLIDTLLNHPEYRSAFGEHTVPFQRRRILPLQQVGLLPFERMPRYGTDYRDRLPTPLRFWQTPHLMPHSTLPLLQSPAAARLGLTLLAAALLLFALLLFNSLFVPS